VESHFYRLVIGVLVTWRLTHLFYGEDGPWKLLVRFRSAVGNGFWGSLLDCFYCLSLWVAIPFAWILGTGWTERTLLWLALSGGAILAERLTARNESKPLYFEEGENEYVLRQGQSATENDLHATRK
jgi:hypothetical protein